MTVPIRSGGRVAELTLLLLCLTNFSLSAAGQHATGEEEETEYFQKPGVTVSEIIEARGYLAEEHTIVTDDGYVLGMTRALNPLIGAHRRRSLNRQPLLFVHGTLVNANTFVMNSFDLREPSDFTEINAERLSEFKLVKMFGREPSAKSLAFFALDFGHEVWFLHRRGSSLSQKRLRLASKPPTPMQKYLAAVEAARERDRFKPNFDPRWPPRGPRAKRQSDMRSEEGAATEMSGARSLSMRSTSMSAARKLVGKEEKKSHTKFKEAVNAAPAALADYGHLGLDIKVTLEKRLWNHSFDEQAAYDLPRAVEYVLHQTGHERLAIVGDSSGGALILMSLVLNPDLGDKLSKAIAWVPSFNIGHTQNNETFAVLQPVFDYIGPFPFTFLSSPFQALMEVACSLEVLQVTLCTATVDSNFGSSDGMAPIRPEFQSNYMTPVSAHEYLHLLQFVIAKQTRMFNYHKKNRLIYGQDEPPYYNVSLINFDYLSIYVGTTDTLVTQQDIETVHRELTVPHRIRLIDHPGVNHGGVFFHEQVADIVIIPSYKDIISHGFKHNNRKGGGRRRFRNRHTHNEFDAA